MFYGFVEKWRQVWAPIPAPNPDASVIVSVVDAFKVFSLQKNGGTAAVPRFSGDLVNDMLNVMGWPADLRRIETGRFVVQDPAAIGPSSRLEAFRNIDDSEGGLLFMGPDGAVVFTSADHVFSNPPAPDQVWGDEPPERDYGDIVVDYDETVLWNDVTVTSPGLVDAPASDPLSIERYLTRDSSLSTVLNYRSDMQTRAFEYVARFSEPRREIVELEVGRRDDLDWKTLLQKSLQDRVTVRRRPAGEPMIEQDSVIEGISVDSPSRNRTSLRWRVSAAYGVNRLLEFQSSFEDGGATGWQVLANCTLTSNTLPFETENVHGVHHMKINAIAAGNASAETTPTTQPSLAVVVGQTYTAAAYLLVPSTPARNCHVEIAWRNASGTFLSATVGASIFVDPAAGFPGQYAQIYATGVAPANAAFATIRVVVESATASRSYYVDAVGFTEGDRRAWSIGRGELV
jgi:hypothetical protein